MKDFQKFILNMHPLIKRYKELQSLERELCSLRGNIGEETATRYAVRTAALMECHEQMRATECYITQQVLNLIDDNG